MGGLLVYTALASLIGSHQPVFAQNWRRGEAFATAHSTHPANPGCLTEMAFVAAASYRFSQTSRLPDLDSVFRGDTSGSLIDNRQAFS
jgi:hypothetical protein